MASPDFSEYIDLTVNDLQPEEVYSAALEYARIALPEFEPRAGSVEDALLQATSYVGAINLAAINRLPDGLMEGILRLFGLERNEATSSTLSVRFNLLNAGSTVPANFIVNYNITVGDEVLQYPFILESAVTAQPAATTVNATLTCMVVGSIPSISVGTTLSLGTVSSNVLSCVTLASVSQGLDAETEAEFFNRGTSFLASLNQSLSTARQIENYILTTYPEVSRCKAYDLVYSSSNVHDTTFTSGEITHGTGANQVTTVQTYMNNFFYGNPYNAVTRRWRVITPSYHGLVSPAQWPSGELTTPFTWSNYTVDDKFLGTFTFTNLGTTTSSNSLQFAEFVLLDGLVKANNAANPGSGAVTVAILGQNGLPVSRDVKKAIYEDIKSKTTAGLYVSVIDAFPYNMDISIEVVLETGYSSVVVEQDVKELLESYYSPSEFPYWDDQIGYSDIASLATSIDGVRSVYSTSVTIPAYGGDGTTRSIYLKNNSTASVTNPATGVYYVTPALYGVLPSASATVTSRTSV